MREFIYFNQDTFFHTYLDDYHYGPEAPVIMYCTEEFYYDITRGLFSEPYRIPPIDELISRLSDPEYLTTYKWQGARVEYINSLLKRDDLTEIQKRLLKMYKAKL